MTDRREITNVGESLPRPDRHRLTVLAPTVVDVVASAGGWLFDQVSAGWSVSVLLAVRGADRPLRILGAGNVGLCTVDACEQQGRRDRAVALSAELLLESHPLRTAVLSTLDACQGTVTLWGNPSPAEFQFNVDTLTYRLSAAAKAFKAHALLAAGAPWDCGRPIEVFRSGVAGNGAAAHVRPLAQPRPTGAPNRRRDE